MKQLGFIEYLMDDVKAELQNLDDYGNAIKAARKEAEKKEKADGKGYGYWFYLQWDKPKPNKTKIKDDLKMIRRLSFEVEKALKEIE